MPLMNFFAAFALAKPKPAESPSSEGWAFAFHAPGVEPAPEEPQPVQRGNAFTYCSTVRGATPNRSADAFHSGNGRESVAAKCPRLIIRAATSLNGLMS